MIFKIVKIKVIIFKNLIYICANNVKKLQCHLNIFD